jgi:hypothetical protein
MDSLDAHRVVNPWHVVDVRRLDRRTVTAVIGQVEASQGLDQFAYREAEIDALWSLTDMAVRDGRAGAAEALALLWTAHDAVGEGVKQRAITALMRLCDGADFEVFNVD